MFNTKGELIQRLRIVLPYADQIVNLDTETSVDAIYFTWRGDIFAAYLSGEVYESSAGTISGSNIAILFSALIKTPCP